MNQTIRMLIKTIIVFIIAVLSVFLMIYIYRNRVLWFCPQREQEPEEPEDVPTGQINSHEYFIDGDGWYNASPNGITSNVANIMMKVKPNNISQVNRKYMLPLIYIPSDLAHESEANIAIYMDERGLLAIKQKMIANLPEYSTQRIYLFKDTLTSFIDGGWHSINVTINLTTNNFIARVDGGASQIIVDRFAIKDQVVSFKPNTVFLGNVPGSKYTNFPGTMKEIYFGRVAKVDLYYNYDTSGGSVANVPYYPVESTGSPEFQSTNTWYVASPNGINRNEFRIKMTIRFDLTRQPTHTRHSTYTLWDLPQKEATWLGYRLEWTPMDSTFILRRKGIPALNLIKFEGVLTDGHRHTIEVSVSNAETVRIAKLFINNKLIGPAIQEVPLVQSKLDAIAPYCVYLAGRPDGGVIFPGTFSNVYFGDMLKTDMAYQL